MDIQDPHALTVMGNTFSNYCNEGYEYVVSKTTELKEYVSSQVTGLRNPETRAQTAYNLAKLTAKAALVTGLCFVAYKEYSWPSRGQQIGQQYEKIRTALREDNREIINKFYHTDSISREFPSLGYFLPSFFQPTKISLQYDVADSFAFWKTTSELKRSFCTYPTWMSSQLTPC